MTLYIIKDLRNERVVAFGTNVETIAKKLVELTLMKGKDFKLEQLANIQAIYITPEYWHIITESAVFETKLPKDIM